MTKDEQKIARYTQSTLDKDSHSVVRLSENWQIRYNPQHNAYYADHVGCTGDQYGGKRPGWGFTISGKTEYCPYCGEVKIPEKLKTLYRLMKMAQ